MIELPIAHQSYQPSAEALVRAVKRVEQILARTLAQETVLDGATVFTNPDRPHVRLANFATDLTLDQAIDAHALLDPIMSYFQRLGVACFGLRSATDNWPSSLIPAIESLGFLPAEQSILRLTQAQLPDPGYQAFQIIPARAAYAQLRNLYTIKASQERSSDSKVAQEKAHALVDLLDEPRLEMFLARCDSQPVGVAGVVTLGQVGVLHGLYTAPQPDSLQAATTLLAHVIEHCSRAQFEHVIVAIDPADPAVELYRSLGFRDAAHFVNYEAPGAGA